MITADEFWKWFEKTNHQFLFLHEVEPAEKERLLNEFIANLHSYCDHLFFQIGGHPDAEKVELIITAEGIKEFFPKVEELVQKAPAMDRWEIIAFKQPHPELGFKVKYINRVFDPTQTWFEPLENESNPELIGIRVCYPDHTKENESDLIAGTYLMLDTLIGERATTLDIDYLEIAPLLINEYSEGMMKLSELRDFIAWKKEEC